MRQPLPVGSVKIDGTWVLGELADDDGLPFLVGMSVKLVASLPSLYGRFIACGLVVIGKKGGQVVCRMNCGWCYSPVYVAYREDVEEDEDKEDLGIRLLFERSSILWQKQLVWN